MENQPQPTYQQPVSDPATGVQTKYAGFWIRWVAYFIDGLVLIIPNTIIKVIVSFIASTANTPMVIGARSLSGLLSFLAAVCYFVYMVYNHQATLGKMAVGIKIISDKPENLNGRLTLGQVFMREIVGKIISSVAICIGYLMIAFTKRKQGLHDIIAGTTVVYKDPAKKVSVWVYIVGVFSVILPILAIAGLFLAVVLTTLNTARIKGSDAQIKSSIINTVVYAAMYEDKNNTLIGYQIPESVKFPECSGSPIINISADGKELAVMAKSCASEEQYFCYDATAKAGVLKVDKTFAEQGRTSCATQ